MVDRSTNIPGNQIEDDTIKQTELDITNTPTDGQILQINMPTGDFTAIDAGVGDVTAGLNITDNAIVRGDGGAKGIQESTATISDNGEMVNTSQPAFLVKPTSSQLNIAVSTTTQVIFGTEIFDQGANFSSNIFTAPVTGRYQLDCAVRLNQADSAATFYLVIIRTSNRDYSIDYRVPFILSGDTNIFATIGVTADMDANDTAQIIVFQAVGTQQTDIEFSETWFSGHLVA